MSVFKIIKLDLNSKTDTLEYINEYYKKRDYDETRI